MEQWKAVQDREGYEVSSRGRVRSLAKTIANGSLKWKKGQDRVRRTEELILKPTLLKIGYFSITLGRGYRRYLHELVLTTFVGPRPTQAVCRHLDGDRLNNHVENLVWGTQKENCQDTLRHGRTTRGGKNSMAKLTATDVRQIRESSLSQRKLARAFDVSRGAIDNIKRGRTWSWL